nr:sulfotransferase domain-containing protein [Natronocella acetinitrilica]
MRNADVHIVSFPKCGRTWLCLMIAKALEYHYGVTVNRPLKLRRFRQKVPGLPLILQHHDGGPEFQRAEALERDKSLYAGKKVIFLVRDPRDVTVSAYFQKTKRNINFEGSIEEYVYHPVGSIETNIAFYNIWAENRAVPSEFLLMTYEDLHEDAVRELRRAFELLGVDDISDETLQRAADECSFDNMRKMEATNALGSGRLAPRDAKDETTYKTREGRAGGYVKHLKPKEIAHIDKLIDERLDDLYGVYKRGAEAE